MGGNGDGAAALRTAGVCSSTGARGAGVRTASTGAVGASGTSCLPRCWVMSSSALRHRDGTHRAPPARAHMGALPGASPDPDEPFGGAARPVELHPPDELMVHG